MLLASLLGVRILRLKLPKLLQAALGDRWHEQDVAGNVCGFGVPKGVDLKGLGSSVLLDSSPTSSPYLKNVIPKF